MRKRYSLFNIVNTIFLGFVALLTMFPFLIVLAVSFTDERSIAKNGFRLIPEKWSLNAYRLLFDGTVIFDAYKITTIVTVTGTVLSVLITSMMAYSLSRKNLKYRNVINMIVYIPMVFSGGLVPFYMVLLKLHLKDNILGLILPILFNPFFMFLMLNSFRGVPDAVIESAKIDGAGEFKIYRSIAIYLALPGIATITLFYALNYWNEWNLALLLINEPKLYPLQYLLRMVLQRVTYVGQAAMTANVSEIPAESTKMATVIVTIGPILLVYPFVQKYFIRGITIGAIKG
ncbi:sugar ABC transporter permease [Clostridium thermosuccinogenes]|jgi:putative aldouronate transport system permease protein|uniref:Sugar ABC transporter permease n=1 Tax=Clostridium thermosuccinogenes TaxID=84032 RepID=A0A2K2EX68_9CLOT|nr:carbohydrate ABC transporter permease [Pseudoclostridium thermosuccinogenes]AUS98217.1 sugar ABC transporter permease [Pseudoclostridium thermosuccinogenes]PNT91127.1 sugar ABC transporter permease [Pseudoclostridium thermosuccinogenes]PNT97165.1 sugar ABC transporter permease [Pseudoclostridium thermosuccinogenes]PNT99057.1 sugar ABC transporter permease [Pseudoclostridium thermosuccinogenes]